MLFFGVGERVHPTSLPSPAHEGEPPSKRPSTGTTFAPGVEIGTPPPLPPAVQSRSEDSLSHSMLPLVSEMQMTLSILQTLLSRRSTHAEDPVLAQQVLHLASKSLQPLSKSMVTAAQQHIKSWLPPASSWQQGTVDVALAHLSPAVTTPELGDINGEGCAPVWSSPVSTTPTHLNTASVAPLQSGGGTVPVAMTLASGVVSMNQQQQQQSLTWSSMTPSDEGLCPPSHTSLSHPSTPHVGPIVTESDLNHSLGLWQGSMPHHQTTQPTELGPLSAGVQSCSYQLSLSSILGCHSDPGPSTPTLSSAISLATGLRIAQITPCSSQSGPSTDNPNPSTTIHPEDGHGAGYVVSLPLTCIPSIPGSISCKPKGPVSDEAHILGTAEKLVSGHSTPLKLLPVSASNSQEMSKVVPLPPLSPIPMSSTPSPPSDQSSPPPPPQGGPGPSGVSSAAAHDPSGIVPASTADHNSGISDDFDPVSDDEFADALMLSLDLPDDDDDDDDGDLPPCGLPPSSRGGASSAAVQIQAPLLVGDYSSYDLMTSLPHVGVADRQEKLTAEGLPLYWSMCVRCSPRCTSTYHMLRLEGGMELDRVAGKLHDAQLDVISVYRVQNETLWQRYRSEQVLMLQGAPKGYKLNEAWLYHTTSAPVEVICEEGLDPRLAHAGNFGSGTYFSDDPMKCFQYVQRSAEDNTHQMLFCRVLLGDTKVYRNGIHDRKLKREPLKETTRPGEKRTYDSVQGNLSGHNEFVVYNAYRVLPEYVIEYSSNDASERRMAMLHYVVHRHRPHQSKKGKN